jgi:hypothetical protein
MFEAMGPATWYDRPDTPRTNPGAVVCLKHFALAASRSPAFVMAHGRGSGPVGFAAAT